MNAIAAASRCGWSSSDPMTRAHRRPCRSNTSTRAPASGRFTSTPTVETETIEREPSVELVKLIRFLADREGVPADPRRFQFRQNELGTISKATLVGGANTPGPPHQRLEGGRSVPSDRDTPSSVPGQSRASRALAIIRLITLACAGVMAFSPKTADHYHAAILAGIALSRP